MQRSPSAARRIREIAVRTLDAREVYSVQGQFGAELGLQSMRLMSNELHNIATPFPSRCSVIESAGLIVPRIFSMLSSLGCPFLLQLEVRRFHVFDGSNVFTFTRAESEPATIQPLHSEFLLWSRGLVWFEGYLLAERSNLLFGWIASDTLVRRHTVASDTEGVNV